MVPTLFGDPPDEDVPVSRGSEQPKNQAEGCLTFEVALRDLNQITAQLESGGADLETSLREFERGIHLLRVCYQLLERAEQKIEQLVGFDASGEAVTAPFDATATAGQPAGKRRGSRKSAARPSGDEDSSLS